MDYTKLANAKILNFKNQGEGVLKLLQNLQLSALNRILSVKNLNRILSSHSTLVGQGLHPDGILDHFFLQFIIKPASADDSFKTLQIRYVERILELSEEKDLNPRIMTSLEAFKKEIHRIAKKRSKSGTIAKKNQYSYLKNLISK